MAAPEMFDLDGRVAVVTGGNGGIGRGIALGLAAAGAAVAVLARNADKNEAVLGELRALNAASIALRLDVTDRAALAPAIDEVERQLGPIDILVNNAGIALPGGVLKVDADDLGSRDRNQPQFVLPALANSGAINGPAQARQDHQYRERVLALRQSRSRPRTRRSKGGLIQLTKSMAIELAAHNIQVNAIVPGWIESEMTAPIKGRPFYDDILMRTPAGRFGTPAGVRGRGGISRFARFRFRNRRDCRRRRRLRDSVSRWRRFIAPR